MSSDQTETAPVNLPAVELAALKTLIAGICHEINNPLTAIQGLADLVAQDTTNPQTREDLGVISRETERAVAIVRRLREFARSADGQPRACSLNDAVRQVLDSRGYELRARGVDIVADLASDLPAVLGRPEDLACLTLLLVLRAERAVLGGQKAREEVITTADNRARLIVTTEAQDGRAVLRVEGGGADAVAPGRSGDDFAASEAIATALNGYVTTGANGLVVSAYFADVM